MDLADPRFLALAIVVAFAFSVEAATGFGATVLAVSLGVHLFPLGTLLPVIVPLGLTLSAFNAFRLRGHVDRRLLARRILPLMGVGLALGLAIFERASNESLQRAYGIFVVWVAASELWRTRHAGASHRPLSSSATRGAILGAGVIHGLFSSGGPLLVYALGRLQIDKAVFRATLSTVWLVLGTALTAAYAWNGRVGRESLVAVAALVPVLAVSFAAGEWAHHRLDEARFRKVVYALLVIAGLTNAL
jgi:uncharacterized membrane protein YfcA